MSFAKKIASLVAETVASPLENSYVFDQGGNTVVLRSRGDHAGADLSGLDLSGVKLEQANLENANLTGANLSGAHLEGANLIGAKFSGTILTGTHLKDAKIEIESLQNAVFDVAPAGLSAEDLVSLKMRAR
jgi:uncharacterized protein YjbI with pentapeptide repeats